MSVAYCNCYCTSGSHWTPDLVSVCMRLRPDLPDTYRLTLCISMSVLLRAVPALSQLCIIFCMRLLHRSPFPSCVREQSAETRCIYLLRHATKGLAAAQGEGLDTRSRLTSHGPLRCGVASHPSRRPLLLEGVLARVDLTRSPVALPVHASHRRRRKVHGERRQHAEAAMFPEEVSRQPQCPSSLQDRRLLHQHRLCHDRPWVLQWDVRHQWWQLLQQLGAPVPPKHGYPGTICQFLDALQPDLNDLSYASLVGWYASSKMVIHSHGSRPLPPCWRRRPYLCQFLTPAHLHLQRWCPRQQLRLQRSRGLWEELRRPRPLQRQRLLLGHPCCMALWWLLDQIQSELAPCFTFDGACLVLRGFVHAHVWPSLAWLQGRWQLFVTLPPFALDCISALSASVCMQTKMRNSPPSHLHHQFAALPSWALVSFLFSSVLSPSQVWLAWRGGALSTSSMDEVPHTGWTLLRLKGRFDVTEVSSGSCITMTPLRMCLGPRCLPGLYVRRLGSTSRLSDHVLWQVSHRPTPSPNPAVAGDHIKSYPGWGLTCLLLCFVTRFSGDTWSCDPLCSYVTEATHQHLTCACTDICGCSTSGHSCAPACHPCSCAGAWQRSCGHQDIADLPTWLSLKLRVRPCSLWPSRRSFFSRGRTASPCARLGPLPFLAGLATCYPGTLSAWLSSGRCVMPPRLDHRAKPWSAEQVAQLDCTTLHSWSGGNMRGRSPLC